MIIEPNRSSATSPLRLLDLFCGVGGFSLGARNAGFEVALSVDIDPVLTSSHSMNFPGQKLLVSDILEFTKDDIFRNAGGEIDGIFGGPPCQGFSEIGKRLEQDPRRYLLKHFFRIVSEVQPKFFVMENVRGLGFRSSLKVLDDALDLVFDRYDVIGPIVLNASDFGAATSRPRLFVIGIKKDHGPVFSLEAINSEMRPATTVRAAIEDLQSAVEIASVDGFDIWKLGKAQSLSQYASMMRSPDCQITGHRATKHSTKVVERFSTVPPGKMDKVGRHPRLHWDGVCPTLRAGTGSDKGSYQSVRPLHPSEPRVITVREAARLQGFPDSFVFHPTVWHSFRMIGNSVSPIIARAIFSALHRHFSDLAVVNNLDSPRSASKIKAGQ